MDDVICLMGPTASGKTAIAIALSELLPVEIVSVDSVMIYRDMDIGTAKPSLSEQQKTPHHLVDILNPDESFSVAAFCEQATDLIHQIHAKGKIPLLVGGTMMYFNALQHGLSALPPTDPVHRAQIEGDARIIGWPALHQRLNLCDPQSAARIEPHDAQRITRALAIFYATNRPMSSFWEKSISTTEWCFYNIGLIPQDRAWLHDRIALRFHQMLSDGFLDEVRQLRTAWHLDLTYPAMRAVGYRQAYEYLEHQCDDASFVEKGIAATRQLAKRQLTWLRSFENTRVFDPAEEEILEKILGCLRLAIAQMGPG